MVAITIYLDNSANSSSNNPPGYNQWVGGTEHGDPRGIKVLKSDTRLQYIFNNTINTLQTWYYDYGWQSGPNINGPFTDNQIIKIPPVVGQVKCSCCIIL